MTTRIAILPYGPSESCVALRNALQARFAGNNNFNVRLLRSSDNSVFRGRNGDIIINYGNRSAPAERFGTAHVINSQSALNNAANKLNALNTMSRAGVSVVPYTTDRTTAIGWSATGDMVYARTTLNGHSGEGIEVITQDNMGNMPVAPLYTKGITGQRREWRIHVFDGVITHVQVKRRRNGYAEDPNYREDVRNHSTGWIYATENINPSQAVLRNAVEAVRAMGLDFGAVDVISHRDNAWVLEVNTAAGLQADTTMTAFVNALDVYINNRTATTASQLRTYNVAFEVQPLPPTAVPVVEEEPADDENFAIPAAPRTPLVEPVEAAPAVQGRPEPQTSRNGRLVGLEVAPDANLEDGYYIADLRMADGLTFASNVLVWVASRRVYRHGWNIAVNPNGVQNLRPISSVTTTNGTTISF